MMKKIKEMIKQIIKQNRWPILSGIMIGTSYIPFPPWAILFCYAPLFLWLDEDVWSRKKAFWGGWFTQFILTLIGFHWVAYTAFEFGGFPWPLAGLVAIGFAAVIHLHIPISCLISHELQRRFKLQGTPAFFVYALVFSLMERFWPMIFPWNMGYTLLWAKIPIFQWADTIGFEGLATVIFLLNAWICAIWQKQDNLQYVFKHVPLMALLIVGLIIGGVYKKKTWSKSEDLIHVLTVQPNIGNAEKIYAEVGQSYKQKIMFKLVGLTQKGLIDSANSDLVVWPETAFPDYLNRPEKSQTTIDIMKSGLATYNKPLVIGTYAQDPDTANPVYSYNALALTTPQGELMSPLYKKTELLAFGEYFPFSENFPILLKWFPFIANFGRGEGPMTLNWPRGNGESFKIGGQICYEGLFPSFTRKLALSGANLLVNVTNDSWFGYPSEPRQHMIMTLARAVEVRRPLVRSTNTGITTAIQANGVMLERSPVRKEWVGVFEMEYDPRNKHSIYTRFGHLDWVLWTLSLIAILIFYRHNSTRNKPTG